MANFKKDEKDDILNFVKESMEKKESEKPESLDGLNDMDDFFVTDKSSGKKAEGPAPEVKKEPVKVTPVKAAPAKAKKPIQEDEFGLDGFSESKPVKSAAEPSLAASVGSLADSLKDAMEEKAAPAPVPSIKAGFSASDIESGLNASAPAVSKAASKDDDYSEVIDKSFKDIFKKDVKAEPAKAEPNKVAEDDFLEAFGGNKKPEKKDDLSDALKAVYSDTPKEPEAVKAPANMVVETPAPVIPEQKIDIPGFDTVDFISIEEVEEKVSEVKAPETEEIKKVTGLKQDIPEPPVLNAKEQKKMDKQIRKNAVKEDKIRADAEKRKWSTYHNGFVLADGERVIKEYACLRLINPPGSGIITVTNKRLLCSTNELAETEIGNISGIISKYKKKFNFVKAFMFLFFGALSAASVLASMDVLLTLSTWWPTMPAWFDYVLYAVCGVSGLIALALLATIYRKEFHIQIFTKNSSSFVTYTGATGKLKPKVIRVRPNKDSRYIVHEIGALILEIKEGKF